MNFRGREFIFSVSNDSFPRRMVESKPSNKEQSEPAIGAAAEFTIVFDEKTLTLPEPKLAVSCSMCVVRVCQSDHAVPTNGCDTHACMSQLSLCERHRAPLQRYRMQPSL